MTNDGKDLVLDVGRVEEGGVDRVLELYDAITSRRDEADEALQATNVFAESAFLLDADDGTFFAAHIEADDWEYVREVYEESDHELDQLHKEILGESLTERTKLEPIYHAVADSKAGDGSEGGE